MRLEPRRLVGEQRVGGGVRFVETIARELVDQIEQFVGLVRGDIVGFGTAFDKDRALRVHLGLDLLAHRAAQQIGATERITRQDLRGLHHLFLIDEDRSEEHTSELQSLMRISYAVFCLKKKKKQQ